ncbi:MAG: hypothetical protein WCX90_07770 [Thiohalomonadaceae bacterium]|jgi:hypothetical protein
MNITSSLHNALHGIQKGMAGIDRNTSEIASAGQMEGKASPIEPLVESKLNRLQVEASAKVMQAVDETIGSLFDDKA